MNRIAFATAALAAAVLTHSAFAATYVVDDSGGPGVSFTNLQSAIDAVAPGDVLIVRPGTYAAFTLDKELTLLGDPGANVNALGTIQNLPAGSRVTVVGLRFFQRLQVLSCAGAVIAEDIYATGGGIYGAVSVTSSADVRLHDCSIYAVYSGTGARINASRVEFSSCNIDGGDGYDAPNGDGSPGGYGIFCENASRVHLALTNVSGGDGGDGCYGFCGNGYGGDGAAGLALFGYSTGIVAGVPSNWIRGGRRGTGNFPGTNAPGIQSNGGLRWSGVTVQGGGSSSGGYAPPIAPGATPPVTPPDPTIEISGTATPGGTMTLVFHGVVGANARLQQGNKPLIDDDGLATIEKLNNRIRIHPLGPIPAGGSIDYVLSVPTSWVPGQFRVFQGLEIDAPTAMLIERTNSVPVIVH